LSVDPLDHLAPDWSPYNYTFNNPSNVTDPDGRFPIAIPLLIYAGEIAFSVVITAFAVNEVTGGALWQDQLQSPGIESTEVDNSGTETLPTEEIDTGTTTVPADATNVSENIINSEKSNLGKLPITPPGKVQDGEWSHPVVDANGNLIGEKVVPTNKPRSKVLEQSGDINRTQQKQEEKKKQEEEQNGQEES